MLPLKMLLHPRQHGIQRTKALRIFKNNLKNTFPVLQPAHRNNIVLKSQNNLGWGRPQARIWPNTQHKPSYTSLLRGFLSWAWNVSQAGDSSTFLALVCDPHSNNLCNVSSFCAARLCAVVLKLLYLKAAVLGMCLNLQVRSHWFILIIFLQAWHPPSMHKHLLEHFCWEVKLEAYLCQTLSRVQMLAGVTVN